MPLPEFAIKHFAGKVTYQVYLIIYPHIPYIFLKDYPKVLCSFFLFFFLKVHKFLDKNHDQVRQEVLDLFMQSKNKVTVLTAQTVLRTFSGFGNIHAYLLHYLFLDGCTAVYKLFRSSQSTEDSQKEQHGYTQIPAVHGCCQVPAISNGARGKDGEVDHVCNVLYLQ